MIRNERQLSAARRDLQGLEVGLEGLRGTDREIQEELMQEVQAEIAEYLMLLDHPVDSFPVRSVDDIPEALIKARLNAGLTQRELASELGVSEQMVQKDEAGGYERARLWRIAEVADALGFDLVGELRKRSAGSSLFAEVQSYTASLNMSRLLAGLAAPEGSAETAASSSGRLLERTA